jgi:hypothetical protein
VTGGDGKDEINPERKTIHENSPYFFVFTYGHFIHSPHPFLPFTLVTRVKGGKQAKQNSKLSCTKHLNDD